MSCILHIDTSTRVCSVALSQDGEVIFSREDLEGPSHAVSCGVYVEEALSFAESHAIPLDAVAVSKGPGSYTGLRIGVSMAKGVCYGRKVPLVGLSTLEVLCVPVLLYHDEIEDDALLVPMIDARRMEVYTARFSPEGQQLSEVEAVIVDENSFSAELSEGPVLFIGDGAAKCAEVINSDNAHFVQTYPHAAGLLSLAEREMNSGNFRDCAYFEPFYLKQFVATVSKKKLF